MVIMSSVRRGFFGIRDRIVTVTVTILDKQGKESTRPTLVYQLLYTPSLLKLRTGGRTYSTLPYGRLRTYCNTTKIEELKPKP
jgi:hypothetical protein